MVMMSYREALYEVMSTALEDPRVIIIGQGVSDCKGIFGTTLGLADKYGYNRVIDTPLAEEGITGICIGAALNGIYPINTHIRADFALSATNQIINLAAKYRYMFDGNFEIPMMIRMVIGRSWGQGAQHSQSLQSLYAHIPGLTVVMPASSWSILNWYKWALTYPNPVIFIEHRLLYDIKFEIEPPTDNSSSFIVRKGKDITIVATSIMVLEAIRAAKYLSDYDIDCEIIDLNCISHPDWSVVIESLKKTGKLLVADTSWLPYGVSAEVCRIISTTDPTLLKVPVVTLGMEFTTCPTAKALEDLFYPNQNKLVHSIVQLVTGKQLHSIPLPDETSMADVYKKFKGPF